jgi:diguanylate cyclase (GGDEF)-like protein
MQPAMSGQLSLPAQHAWTRRKRLPVVGTVVTLIVFLGALLAVVVITLNRSATRATRQQAATQLASSARVGASLLAVDRAELRTRAGQLAAASDLQRAVLAGDGAELARIAALRHVRLEVGSHRFDGLPRPPRLTAKASIETAGRIVARVTVALPLRDATLARLRAATPLPPGAALLLVRGGQVIVGADRRSTRFVSGNARVPATTIDVLAIAPLAAVTTSSSAYGRRTIFAAILTLLIAVGLAIRFARPVARTFGELSDQAEHDPLTGLANRRLLDARLDEELERARRHGTHLAFVLVDVDDFKQFNDRYGHQCGDEILRTFGALLANSLRELDLAGRFGGEEFALVLPGTPVAGACLLAEQIRRSLAEIDVPGPAGERLRITASFGAAAYPDCATTVDQLIQVADRSVYEAKRRGKDQVVGAGASMPAHGGSTRTNGRRP